MQGENNKIARYFSVYLSRRGEVHGSFRLSGPDHDYSVHYQTSFRLYFLVGDPTEGSDPGRYNAAKHCRGLSLCGALIVIQKLRLCDSVESSANSIRLFKYALCLFKYAFVLVCTIDRYSLKNKGDFL